MIYTRTLKLFAVLFPLFNFISSFGYAQIHDSLLLNPSYHFNKAYIKSYWYDTRDIALAPVYWKRNQWIAFSSVTAASVFVYLKDEQMQQVFQKNRSAGGDQFSKYVLEPWGSGFYTASLMAGFYLEGLISGNNRSKKMALLGTKTLLITAGYSRIPKYTFQRHRPFQDMPGQPEKWEGPLHGLSDYTSFTSGHAVSVFAMAAVIASEYADYWPVPLLSYGLAGAVAASRIYDNKHWASDVLVGAAFGYAMGKLIYHKDSWINGGKWRHRKKVTGTW